VGDTEGRSGLKTGTHRVSPGQCVVSLAEASGHFWQTIWEHPGNTELRRLRGRPNMLVPGDEVFIPPLRGKSVTAGAGQRHVFRRKGVPTFLHLRIAYMGQARAHKPCLLKIAGRELTGMTDKDGLLTIALPRGASIGELTVGEGEDARTHRVHVGELQPPQSLVGIQERLHNLGFATGELNGRLSPATQKALRDFQRQWGLAETGTPDAQTQARLVEQHGC